MTRARGRAWVAGAALALAACRKTAAPPAAGAQDGGGGRGKAEFAVQVAPVELRQVGYVVTASGSIQGFEQVLVTARVGGAVDRVLFTDGQTVKKDDVLVVIEVARYQVAVEQAKAAVDKAGAALAQAEQNLARREKSNAEHPGLIPGEEIATVQTQVQTAKADVQAAHETLKVAQLNLRDASVRAPLAGVIQTRTVETGQYLAPGAVLATLLQRDPLLLKFQVTEQDAPRIKPGMTVTLSLRETARTYQAKITLVAASADPQSHLVPVTGEIDDKEHKYWLRPGVFCDVTIPVGNTRQAAVVPELAIRASERGFLAYVVQGNIAKERVVSLGMHTGLGFVEITEGLSPGDLLVVRGADPLNDGSPVKIVERTTLDAIDAGVMPPAATAPAPHSWRPHDGGAPEDAGARP
jgi:multidrug efflux system membrane fusion protein